MPEPTTGEPTEPVTPAAGEGGEPTTPASLTLPADLVRNSPEYRALSRQVREAERARGRAEAEAAKVREEAENARQAAEAQRMSAMSEQIETILGADGVAAYNEIAALSDTNPIEAARKFRELAAKVAQSAVAPAPAATSEPTGGTPVPAQPQPSTTPPVPSSGLSGDAPLGQPIIGTDWDAIATDADKRYAEIVQRNQDPVTRARVTDRERGEGFMSWLSASYVRGMKTLGRLPRG